MTPVSIPTQIFMLIAYGSLLPVASPVAAESTLQGAGIFAVSTNCTGNTQPCGPAPSCCQEGLECNFRRGIPVCQDPTQKYSFGSDHDPCLDPYLFRCDEVLGIPGFCCPLGTVCFNNGEDHVVQCVNALGATASGIPSATTGLIPSATPVAGDDPAIHYSPPSAWKEISSTESTCISNSSLHVTNTINASVSVTYTSPGITVHVVTSPNGGVFSLVLDGFNTTTNIDTYSGPGDLSLPTCYPLQFPPFAAIPPDYQSRKNHTLTLVFIGDSPLAPNGTNASNIQFESFSIPDVESVVVTTSSNTAARMFTMGHALSICLLFTVVLTLAHLH